MNVSYHKAPVTRVFHIMNYPGHSATIILSRKVNTKINIVTMMLQHRVKIGKGRGASFQYSFVINPLFTAITGIPVPMNPRRECNMQLKLTARLSRRVFSRTKEKITVEEIRNAKLGIL